MMERFNPFKKHQEESESATNEQNSIESESRFSPEREPSQQPHIRLEFFRHDDKLKAAEGQSDETVRLTEGGREHATEAGKSRNPQAESAIAFGSNRERSTETAMRQMLAKEDEITPGMSLEDIRAKVVEYLKVGKKDQAIEALNFYWDESTGFKDKALKRYSESKDAIVFFWKESDDLVKELKDLNSDTYTRSAGKVAEVIKKYINILPRWEQILENDTRGKYKELNSEMQRFLGSHQTVTEQFLIKVIEKTGGTQAVEQFIQSLDGNGFDFSEGYSVDISEENGQAVAVVRFRDKEWRVDEAMLDNIIAERDQLNEEVKKELTETV